MLFFKCKIYNSSNSLPRRILPNSRRSPPIKIILLILKNILQRTQLNHLPIIINRRIINRTNIQIPITIISLNRPKICVKRFFWMGSAFV